MLRLHLSWTAVTQVSLAGTQLLLLPLQVRTWGIETTAAWNAAVALAALLLAADFGLRGFGHASLRQGPGGRTSGSESFVSVWAAQRLLATGVLLLAAIAASVAMWLRLSPSADWLLGLVIAFAVEALIGARLMYMDTLGMIARAEASYAMLVSTRLAAALLALAVFDAGPVTLAVIYAVTAVGALFLQGLWLRSTPALHLSAGGFRHLDARTFLLLRYAIGYPLAQWCRTSLPVLVLQSVASAAIVNTFVALRAIFGLARQAIQQLARHASVQHAATTDSALRRSTLLKWTYACVLAGTACSLAVQLDAGVILSSWVPGASSPGYHWVTLAFSLAGPLFATQVLVLAYMRTGAERHAAGLESSYIALALMAALATTAASSLAAYFACFFACELAYAAIVLGRTRQLQVAGEFLRWTLTGMALVMAAALVITWTGSTGATRHDALLRGGVFMVLLSTMLMHGRSLLAQRAREVG